jgi:tripartite ATP-independent transporter DctM subunit
MATAAANDSIRDHLFSVVPLFVLMGILVSVSNVGRDTFDVMQALLKRLKGGLAISTIGANAVFAAITGISIASASVFTRVAVPEMIRHGYDKRLAVGVVAGSSVLGMLIPPSLLFIVFGVIAQESVGRLFIAGIGPGLLLTAVFIVTIAIIVRLRPVIQPVSNLGDIATPSETTYSLIAKGLPIFALIFLVLGGIYGGIFTPTEAGAVGSAGALVIALIKRNLSLKQFWQVLMETGQVSVSILFLIMAASLYSRMLAFTGVPSQLGEFITGQGLGPYGFLMIYILILLLLGAIIDSVSIMLIVLPIVLPMIGVYQFDLVWFGVITVIAVEIGLLTPPFGISVFTVKASLEDKSITLGDIFKGTIPFMIGMLIVLMAVVAFPQIALFFVETLS